MQPQKNGHCGKVIHLSYSSANMQASDLQDKYGLKAGIYICKSCTRFFKKTIWHIGYGYDASKLAKRARRHRKQASASKRKKNGR